jgi:cell division protein FtsB
MVRSGRAGAAGTAAAVPAAPSSNSDHDSESEAPMTQALARSREEIFRPKGDQPEWRLLYDEFRKHGPGDVITYQRLTDILGRDFRASRVPLARAVKELENADHRTLVCERGTGYRIAAATEHEHLAHAHSKRSRRQLTKAVAKARSANRAELTPDQVRRLDNLEVHLSQQAAMLTRLDARDKQREAQIKQLRRDTTSEIAAIDDRLTHLTDMLRRHGITTGPVPAPAQT